MRLLIYLLAMMTGFSAAEAARPVAATPAAVAQGTVIAVSVALVEQDIAAKLPEDQPFLAAVASGSVRTALALSVSSPVLRNDLTRQ
jgi:hypothetical protein